MSGTSLISAALIVRDEETHLPACLASLHGIVDEIVVVDTGSRDDTAAIARAAGARVLERPWSGDFAAARNHGLDHVRGRWVLYIDADERLAPVARSELEQLLCRSDDVVALRTWLRPAAHATAYRELRLWRNDPRIRFRGLIHEKIHGAILAVARADGLRIVDCELLLLEHVGYDGDQTVKHRRNLPLLETQLELDPSDIYSWRHLGQVRLGLGDERGAERALTHALELALRSVPPDEHGRLAYADLLELHQNRGEDVEALAEEALARYPHDWMLVWLRAGVAIHAGHPEQALEWLDALVAVAPATLPDTVAYDRRIFAGAAHAARGLCLFRLGRYAEAAVAYRAAERSEPGALEPRVKRQLAEARAASEFDGDGE